jgi:ABC-type transport system involved in multi-copper enzyme maturation permease subunit
MGLNSGFIALLVLAAIHLFANQAKVMGWVWHGRFLSFAAGITFAYVFVGLLPALQKGQPVLKRTFDQFVPYLDRHVYLIALVGLLFYYGIQTYAQTGTAKNFWLAISGYLLFNFFVGVSLSDSNNPEIQPLTLFTIAMGMHYFVRDHNAGTENRSLYQRQGRWWLIASLLLGYAVGYLTHIPDAVAAIAISFVAGGVLLNVFHYELPKRERVGYGCFVLGSLLYTTVLLGVGEIHFFSIGQLFLPKI